MSYTSNGTCDLFDFFVVELVPVVVDVRGFFARFWLGNSDENFVRPRGPASKREDSFWKRIEYGSEIPAVKCRATTTLPGTVNCQR